MPERLRTHLRALGRLAADMAESYTEPELAPYAEDLAEAHDGLLAVLDHLTAPVELVGAAGEP